MTELLTSAPTSAHPARGRPPARALVFHGPAGTSGDGHDVLTKKAVARSLARLLGLEFQDDADRARQAHASLYHVPCETIVDVAAAERLGIRQASDLFGGVVPAPFIATKVITHPLVHADAAAPDGWCRAHADCVAGVVLPGYSVFTVADARRGAAELLQHGAVRLKAAAGVGGTGQSVVGDGAQLEAQLAAIDPQQLRRDGLVLERNLSKVVTHSVGQVQVGAWRATYIGEQYSTRNHHGHDVYAGSSLHVVRGGFEALLDLELEGAARTAVDQALVYHRAALMLYPGMFASRCNYDVAQGIDDSGRWRSGVLEQSWRIGGASGAEIAALHAFAADPELRMVRATTREVYGEGVAVPPRAVVHYEGVDPQVGPITKYVEVKSGVPAHVHV